MFELEREVLAWCRSIHASGPDRQERTDELADHLFCEIDRLTAQGLSDEQAFQMATRRMGETDALIQEHSKNTGGASKVWSVFRALGTCNSGALGEMLSDKERSALLIAVSLVFAGAMLFASYLMRASEHSQTVTYALIAVWWIPFSVLSTAGQHGRESCALGRRSRSKM